MVTEDKHGPTEHPADPKIKQGRIKSMHIITMYISVKLYSMFPNHLAADFTGEPLADAKTHLNHPEHDSGDENETQAEPVVIPSAKKSSHPLALVTKHPIAKRNFTTIIPTPHVAHDNFDKRIKGNFTLSAISIFKENNMYNRYLSYFYMFRYHAAAGESSQASYYRRHNPQSVRP